jgi:hypothetical protein
MSAFDPTPAGVNGSAVAVATSTYHAATPSMRTSPATNHVEPTRSRPSPSPRPAVIEGGPVASPQPTAPPPPIGGLLRRVPQSHLSAQLREPEPEFALQSMVPERTTAETAAALSRYQASRAAAQAAAEKGNRS